jgi:transposase
LVARWFHPVNRDQGCLLPADVRAWLPADHLAWQVIGVAGELDLSRFAGAYRADGQGQAPYDPAMMAGLLLYCYFKGIRSSRKIAGACVDDLGCVVICGGARPSHRAVAGFIRRHRGEVKRLFVQVLSLLAAEGAVGGQIAAVDGSPVSASASRFANVTGEQLADAVAAAEAAIDAEVEAWLDGAAAAGQAGQQPLWDGDDDDSLPGGGGVPRRLGALGAKLARLRAAQAKLAERQAAAGKNTPGARVRAAEQAVANAARRLARAEAAQAAKMDRYQRMADAGKAWPYGKKPVPAERSARVAIVRGRLESAQARLHAARQDAAAAPAKVSATDPDTRLLPAKNGGWLQGWNLQLTASRRQVLLAVGLHDNPNDAGALTEMIEAALANCDLAGLAGRIRAWLADNGYACAASFKALDHLMLLVSVQAEAAQTGRADATAPVPDGWQRMAARLATPAGKSLYKRRAALVEPAFAQFFARFGSYLNYRGHDAADTEIHLLGAVHNLAKLLDHRQRRLAAAT